MHEQVVAYSDYIVWESDPSPIGLMEEVREEVGFSCPRCCKIYHYPLKHGSQGEFCSKCRLLLFRWHDMLICSSHDEDTAKWIEKRGARRNA